MPADFELQEQGTDRESVRFLKGLLYFGLFITLAFLIVYLATARDGLAAIVASLSLLYIISIGLVHRRRHIRLVLRFTLLASSAGLLLSAHMLPVSAVWLPILAVAAFVLLQRDGASWAILQFVGIGVVFAIDALSPHPLYTLSGRLNILFSFIAVVTMCYLFLLRVQQKQRKLAEFAGRLAYEKAERARLEMVRRLAGGMAHLINNEMQIILSRGDLLKRRLPAAMGEDIESIQAIAMQASDHTRKLLTYAEGGWQRAHQRVDAGRLLRQVADAWLHRLPAGISLHLESGGGGPVCDGDEAEMVQVLNGLIENAVEASAHEGRIDLGLDTAEIKADAAGGPRPGHYARITVRDHGHGMSETVKAHIFEPFYTTRFAGRGLGLSAIYGIIHHSGGWIDVESREGAGSLFTVWWPQSSEDDGDIHDRMSASEGMNEERI